VSAEKNPNDTREQELWERISTTEGADRAEVLDELSHLAYNRNKYNECLQLIESSLEIYYKLGGAHNYLKEMTHLYEGKAHCLDNLNRPKNLAMAIAGEAGELVAEFQWLKAEESIRGALSVEKFRDIELEVADVAIYLLRLSDVLGIDLAQAIRKKMDINQARF